MNLNMRSIRNWEYNELFAIGRAPVSGPYLIHELTHYAIPLPRVRVIHAILAIRDELNTILKPDHVSDLLQQVDTEALEPGRGAVLCHAGHHVWRFLDTILQLYRCSSIQGDGTTTAKWVHYKT